MSTTVPCPGCNAPVEPKFGGKKGVFAIPPHNPPSGNLKGANPRELCPGAYELVPNYKPAPGLVG